MSFFSGFFGGTKSQVGAPTKTFVVQDVALYDTPHFAKDKWFYLYQGGLQDQTTKMLQPCTIKIFSGSMKKEAKHEWEFMNSEEYKAQLATNKSQMLEVFGSSLDPSCRLLTLTGQPAWPNYDWISISQVLPACPNLGFYAKARAAKQGSLGHEELSEGDFVEFSTQVCQAMKILWKPSSTKSKKAFLHGFIRNDSFYFKEVDSQVKICLGNFFYSEFVASNLSHEKHMVEYGPSDLKGRKEYDLQNEIWSYLTEVITLCFMNDSKFMKELAFIKQNRKSLATYILQSVSFSVELRTCLASYFKPLEEKQYILPWEWLLGFIEKSYLPKVGNPKPKDLFEWLRLEILKKDPNSRGLKNATPDQPPENRNPFLETSTIGSQSLEPAAPQEERNPNPFTQSVDESQKESYLKTMKPIFTDDTVPKHFDLSAARGIDTPRLSLQPVFGQQESPTPEVNAWGLNHNQYLTSGTAAVERTINQTVVFSPSQSGFPAELNSEMSWNKDRTPAKVDVQKQLSVEVLLCPVWLLLDIAESAYELAEGWKSLVPEFGGMVILADCAFSIASSYKEELEEFSGNFQPGNHDKAFQFLDQLKLDIQVLLEERNMSRKKMLVQSMSTETEVKNYAEYVEQVGKTALVSEDKKTEQFLHYLMKKFPRRQQGVRELVQRRLKKLVDKIAYYTLLKKDLKEEVYKTVDEIQLDLEYLEGY